jgi:hypothetical protein
MSAVWRKAFLCGSTLTLRFLMVMVSSAVSPIRALTLSRPQSRADFARARATRQQSLIGCHEFVCKRTFLSHVHQGAADSHKRY